MRPCHSDVVSFFILQIILKKLIQLFLNFEKGFQGLAQNTINRVIVCYAYENIQKVFVTRYVGL